MKWCMGLLIVLILAILLLVGLKEGFGSTSPGTMVQLQTSHVPTKDDIFFYKYVYPNIVRKEIYNLTESDLD